jgi:hypothetical protein
MGLPEISIMILPGSKPIPYGLGTPMARGCKLISAMHNFMKPELQGNGQWDKSAGASINPLVSSNNQITAQRYPKPNVPSNRIMIFNCPVEA